ncbi:MAG: antitoxin Xre/MbcA/ParS toxin-binding domain-containing protein [Alphaproteobacteria bacterium]
MIAAEKVAEALGGERVLACKIRDYADLNRVVHERLPFAALKHLIDSDKLTVVEVKRHLIPSTSYARRVKSKRLSVVESEKAERLARVFATAEEAYRNKDKAHRWLRAPNPELDGKTPLEIAATELGARQVETILWQIAHGIPA